MQTLFSAPSPRLLWKIDPGLQAGTYHLFHLQDGHKTHWAKATQCADGWAVQRQDTFVIVGTETEALDLLWRLRELHHPFCECSQCDVGRLCGEI